MAAAESLDLRMRAGTVEATTLSAGLPDPPAAARTGDPFADAMALAAAQGGPSGTALLQREGVHVVAPAFFFEKAFACWRQRW